MSLDILRNHKVKKELKIVTINLLEINPELEFALEIPDGLDIVDHSKETMKKNIVIFPSFESSFLLPIQYNHVKSGKTLNTYPSYANYLGFEIEYRKGDIMKVNLVKGVHVLKQSDERFIHELIIDEPQPYHFEYNKEKERWKILNDVEIFNSIQKEIENAIKSPEIMKIIKDYFHFRKTYYKKLTNMHVVNPTDAPDYVLNNIKIIYDYHEFQNLIGEITDPHFELIKRQIQILKDYVAEKKNTIQDPNLSTHKIKDTISDMIGNVKTVLSTESYWIIGDEIYPNIARLYALKQKAETPRTPETQKLLKKAILAYKNKYKKEVKDINNKQFTDFMKKLT